VVKRISLPLAKGELEGGRPDLSGKVTGGDLSSSSFRAKADSPDKLEDSKRMLFDHEHISIFKH
jgi:hypothetical protein